MKRIYQNPIRSNNWRSQLPSARLAQTHFSVYVLTIVLALFALVSFALLFAPWQQSSKGVGRVVAFDPLERRQVLGAPIKGRISAWRVTEGTFVKKGQVIAVMEDLDPLAIQRIRRQRGAVLEQKRLAKKQARAYSKKIQSLKNVRKLHFRANRLKIRMTRQKYLGALQKRKAIRAALRTARLNLKRLVLLRKDEIISKRTLELARLKVTKLRMDSKIAKAALYAARSQIIEARAQQLKKDSEDRSKINSAEADYQKAMDKTAVAKNKLAELELKVARQAAQVIRAPRDAVILRLLVNEGSEMLKAGDSIAVLVPRTTDFAVELWVDGNDIPLLKRGRKVRLQFEGWPAVQFVGWPSVAVGTFGGIVALVDVANSKNGTFRVVVKPDPGDDPWPKTPFLRQGMKTKGWILLDEVRLGYELWRQLNGFPPTVEVPDKPTKKNKVKKNKSS